MIKAIILPESSSRGSNAFPKIEFLQRSLLNTIWFNSSRVLVPVGSSNLHFIACPGVEEVVNKLWKGKSEEQFLQLVHSAPYTVGVYELFLWLNKHNYITAIISSGPKQLAERAQKDWEQV